MTAQELNQMIIDGYPPLIIDVRSRLEFKTGHIPGAIHVSMYKLAFRLTKLPKADGRTAVLTCEHGPRAQMAKPFVAKAGYIQLEMLEGHMAGWRKAGFAIEK